MRFRDRKEQRNVTETMASLLTPLLNHVAENTATCINKTLQILSDTEIEGEQNESTD